MVIWEKVLLFAFGCVVGSFLNVCIYRIPHKQSVVFPPSHCPYCGYRLRARDLIPVLSYLALKGRCGGCKERISIQYPIVELVTGAVFLLLSYPTDHWAEYLLNVALMSALICAFMIDLKTLEIPNIFVLFALGLAVVKAIVLTPDLKDVLLGAVSASGLFLCFYILGLLFLKMEVVGVGDIKILFALGAFLGFESLLVMTLLAIYLAAIAAVVVLLTGKKEQFPHLPMAPFFSFSTLIVLAGVNRIPMLWMWFLPGVG